MSMKIVAVILFIVACIALYFGGGWLFIMPRFPGESYFTFERLLYGVGSTLLAAGLLTLVGWIWTRSDSRISPCKAIVNSFRWAVAAVGLFWLALMVIGGIRQD